MLKAASPRVAIESAGRSRALHAAVEDHAGVGAALVLLEELDDRLAADLLLAVGDDADVDRQRAVGGEQARPRAAASRAGPCRRRCRARRSTRRGSSARTDRTPRARAAPAAARRSGRSRGSSARSRRPVDARISPTTSGRSPYGTSSASPPPRRILSATHSAACSTSAWCAGSALTDGMRSSSPSSSNQSWRSSLTAASLVRRRAAARSGTALSGDCGFPKSSQDATQMRVTAALSLSAARPARRGGAPRARARTS